MIAVLILITFLILFGNKIIRLVQKSRPLDSLDAKLSKENEELAKALVEKKMKYNSLLETKSLLIDSDERNVNFHQLANEHFSNDNSRNDLKDSHFKSAPSINELGNSHFNTSTTSNFKIDDDYYDEEK